MCPLRKLFQITQWEHDLGSTFDMEDWQTIAHNLSLGIKYYCGSGRIWFRSEWPKCIHKPLFCVLGIVAN